MLARLQVDGLVALRVQRLVRGRERAEPRARAAEQSVMPRPAVRVARGAARGSTGVRVLGAGSADATELARRFGVRTIWPKARFASLVVT